MQAPSPDTLAPLDRRKAFVQTLSQTFIPATLQLMQPFGLTSYIPTLWPEPRIGIPANGPAESALVFYESIERYKHVKETPVGRLYGKSHELLFQKGMCADFPVAYATSSELDKAYYGGSDDTAMWKNQSVMACSLYLDKPRTQENWLATFVTPLVKQMSDFLGGWIAFAKSAPPTDQSDASQKSLNWCTYWFCLKDKAELEPEKLNQLLSQFAADVSAQLWWVSKAQDVAVPLDTHATFPGVALSDGQTLRLSP